MTSSQPAADQAAELLALYDDALPQVYGYLVRRCASSALAEDLTAETFLAAVLGIQRGTVEHLTTAWLVGVARNKLVDHWRRQEREERGLQAVAGEASEGVEDWNPVLEEGPALACLAGLGPHHRAVLTLRYLDGLPVREVAGCLGRTEGATEQLLLRAKAAFRHHYERRDER